MGPPVLPCLPPLQMPGEEHCPGWKAKRRHPPHLGEGLLPALLLGGALFPTISQTFALGQGTWGKHTSCRVLPLTTQPALTLTITPLFSFSLSLSLSLSLFLSPLASVTAHRERQTVAEATEAGRQGGGCWTEPSHTQPAFWDTETWLGGFCSSSCAVELWVGSCKFAMLSRTFANAQFETLSGLGEDANPPPTRPAGPGWQRV